MDNSGSRSPRDSDSSPLPCPSFTDDFDDSQETEYELPRKRIRDFEFEENTLHEFPATSRELNIPNNTLSFNGMIARETSTNVAKENLDPIKLIVNEKSSLTNFTDDVRILHQKNNSGNNRASTVGDTCINCRISIDLKKIWELVESQPHLFSKYDEKQCNTLRAHEINLTKACRWKNTLLLVESKSQDSFYDNTIETKMCQLKKSKSMENLVDMQENDGNREEIKTRSPTKNNNNLRRGLKRKCKYSTPIR